jgi:colanic acid biosynthesis glycosyl transferase WcaI
VLRVSLIGAGRRPGVDRIIVHDFSGHPFQVQLARSLAAGGRRVTHVYCDSFQTPRGAVGGSGGDSGFSSVSIDLGREFAKYSLVRRMRDEVVYGLRFCRLARKLEPSLVISANTPLLAALIIQMYLLVRRTPVVFWQQDIYSMAMRQHLEERAGRIGSIVGALFQQVEKLLVRTSAWVVVISDDFIDTLVAWRVDQQRLSVIENWAPLDEVPVVPRPNEWSRRHGFADDDIVLLYAGTLGLKHQPSMLLELGRAFADRPDVRVVVASEGIGADWLRERVTDAREVELFPFQAYSDLPAMLGTGDVLLVLLEPGAGKFSVPSKVLTYHCAGRVLLGAIPSENLATRTIERNGSGLVVEPGDSAAFIDAARRLVDDDGLRAAMSSAARSYAERAFDIDTITASFAHIIDVCLENDDDERPSPDAVAAR